MTSRQVKAVASPRDAALHVSPSVLTKPRGSPPLAVIMRPAGALAARSNAPLVQRHRLDQCEHRIAGLERKLVDRHAGRHSDQMAVAVEIDRDGGERAVG